MYWFWYIRELMVVPISILSLSSVVCIVKLYLYIAKHIKSVSGYIEQSRLKDERSLLRAITMQGLLPLLSSTPALWMIYIGSLGKDADNWKVMLQSFSIGPFEIIAPFVNMSITLMSWNPVIDPLLTLFCVRQYRQVFVGWLRKFYYKTNIGQWLKMEAVSSTVYPL
uniref:G protein-coupled receptor n=1 Tax=Plectus sambesii TaxID=2011161 RepID=A0A914W6T4_9BILA